MSDAYVVSLNLHRRHLNESQRGMIAVRRKGRYEEKALEKQNTGKKDLTANLQEGRSARESNAKAGAELGVSGRIAADGNIPHTSAPSRRG